jgi:hypothetical protein
MVAGLLITAIAGILFWLVFFKFKWIRLTYGWGLFFALGGGFDAAPASVIAN